MSKDELKACPFCGGANVIDFIDRGESGKVYLCEGCSSFSPIWNTRRAQWVAVSERLPEDSAYVFIVSKGLFIGIGQRYNNACGNYVWFTNHEAPVLHDGQVSYWLPLDWLPRPETAARADTRGGGYITTKYYNREYKRRQEEK